MLWICLFSLSLPNTIVRTACSDLWPIKTCCTHVSRYSFVEMTTPALLFLHHDIKLVSMPWLQCTSSSVDHGRKPQAGRGLLSEWRPSYGPSLSIPTDRCHLKADVQDHILKWNKINSSSPPCFILSPSVLRFICTSIIIKWMSSAISFVRTFFIVVWTKEKKPPCAQRDALNS